MSVRRAGFTLIELAIVLVIIALVASMGVDLARSARSGSARVVTQERLAVIQKTLDQFASRYGYLPCPSAITAVPGDTGFGYEQRLPTGGYGCNVANITRHGFTGTSSLKGGLPFRTLGLPDSYAADAWGRKFFYSVSEPHTGLSETGPAAYREWPGNITIRTGTLTDNRILTSTASGAPGEGATFVVLSTGANGIGGYPLASTTPSRACPTGFGGPNNPEALNCAINCPCVLWNYFDNPYNDGTTALAFDDYIIWGTNNASKSSVSSTVAEGPGSCSGACEPWCAPCSTNINSAVKGKLCTKFITATTPCAAACIWSGGAMPCP